MQSIPHIAPLIRDLAFILGIAAITALFFKLIKLPLSLGYLVAGILVGPHTPPSPLVSDIPNIKTFAELGVIFLMFTLGLEFSFRKLARVGTEAASTTLFEVFFMVASSFLLLNFLNSHYPNLLLLSKKELYVIPLMLAISSTTIAIKSLEDLGANTKKFAEFVYGILIVEDLVAILILASLSTFFSNGEIKLSEFTFSILKLMGIVGSWFVFGYFLIPRVVKSTARFGTSEMLTVLSVGLCLILAVVSSQFQYSPALGAFIMGSILAESDESEYIENLMRPLKDVFAAVFFVSVGMLIDPTSIEQNLTLILILSSIVIFGKIIGIFSGGSLSGHSLKASLQAGFSLAQIGEFSFIIAALAMDRGEISSGLYSVIVAVSVLTTFTTPLLVRLIVKYGDYLEKRIPKKIQKIHNAYSSFLALQSLKIFFKPETKQKFLQLPELLSGAKKKKHSATADHYKTLAPWDGHLVRMKLHPDSEFAGLQIKKAALRNRYGLNIVAIERGSKAIVTPDPEIQLFPFDELLVLGTDEQISKVQNRIEKPAKTISADSENEKIRNYRLKRFFILENSNLVGKTIRNSKLREKYSAMVVGIERNGERLSNPDSDLTILNQDVLWIVAENNNFEELAKL